MRRKFSIRDFGAGAVVGLVIGTSGLAAAALSYTGWQKLSQDFKIGYVTGYLDMAGIARNLDPGGYVDTRYPRAHAKAVEWAALIDKLYKDPEYQSYSINSMMQAVAHKLQEQFGATSADERMKSRMARQLEMIKKRQELQAEKAGKQPPKNTKLVEAPEKKVSPPKKPTTRKWCRCDGKDPKAERARRRAARAEAEKAAGAKPGAETKPAVKPDAAKSPADAAKPEAAKPDAAKPEAAKPDAAKPEAAKSPPAPARP
jgi:hypothetical protein